ncbi:hypothetical protein MINTM020_37850 [Mycobacterium paraintracellulare]|nr:hypothetical protein MINTM020_37850 [Mycobacterium paraintracellulare]
MQDDDCQLLVPIADAGPNYLGGVGLTTVYKLIANGELVKVNIGRRGFITRKSIEAYVDRLAAK